jgi:hypothetical protein
MSMRAIRETGPCKANVRREGCRLDIQQVPALLTAFRLPDPAPGSTQEPMNDHQPHRSVASRAGLRPTSRATLAALVSGFALAGTAFAAAPAKEEPIKLEAFVSTGTRFSDRTVIESPVPIDIVLGTELQKGGYTEVSQMLQAQVPSFNFPRPSLTDGTDHIRPATLRGLAPDQVLVLVNGKRRHSSALVNVNGSVGRGSVSVDFNAFP